MTDPNLPGPAAPPEPSPGRARGYPPGLLPVLVLTLVVSLITALVLAVRLGDQRTQLSQMQELADRQERALDTLRAGIRDQPSALAGIQRAVEDIRGLRFRRRVDPEVLTSAQLAERIRRLFTEQTSRSEFAATQKVLEALGLASPEEDLYDVLLAAQEEQVAGFYDSDAKKLVVEAQEAEHPTPLDQLILAHELTHAVTDQHFGLARLDTLNEQRRDDEATAFLSLAEGDAQLVSELYVTAALTTDEQVRLSQQLQDLSTDGLDALPPFMQEALSFPYTRGLAFVRALHRRGGFAAVDAAYRDPPRSTEQIMHPSRYISARDEPVSVTMPAVRTALGSGWRQIDRGGMGELDLLLIADHGGANYPASKARRAAAGWDGGAYAAFESGDGVLVAALTAWDSVIEAREAAELFGDWLPMRFRNVGASFNAGPGNRGWETENGAGMIVRGGDRVALLLGPDRASVEQARRAFRGF